MFNSTTENVRSRFDLCELGEASTAIVEQTINSEGTSAYASTDLSIYVSADDEASTVYVSLDTSTFVRTSFNENPLFTNTSVLAHRFTREQAEALVKVLSHELSKF